VRYLLGQALRRAGRNDEATPLLLAGNPEAPQFPDPRLDQLFDAQRGLDAEYERADRLLAAGELTQAQRGIQSALQIWPQDISLLSRLGEVHRRRGDAAAWLRAAKRSVGIDENSFAAQLNLSMALRANDQPGPALKAAVDAAHLSPNVPEGHLQVARMHLVGRRTAEAIGPLDRAFALGVTSPQERLQYAAVLLDVGRFDDAITQGNAIVEAYPGTPPAWIILAQAHRSAGRLPVAFDTAFAGLQNNAGHPQLAALVEEIRAQGLAQQETDR
jgi:predicted Zn-dependent protease